jgi:cytochrome c
LIGRKAGSVPGFRYSRALKNANLVWNDATLDAYLAEPQTAVPGNTMPFPGLPDAMQRFALIAYLKTLK